MTELAKGPSLKDIFGPDRKDFNDPDRMAENTARVAQANENLRRVIGYDHPSIRYLPKDDLSAGVPYPLTPAEIDQRHRDLDRRNVKLK